jgi:hypothetical protein
VSTKSIPAARMASKLATRRQCDKSSPSIMFAAYHQQIQKLQ